MLPVCAKQQFTTPPEQLIVGRGYTLGQSPHTWQGKTLRNGIPSRSMSVRVGLLRVSLMGSEWQTNDQGDQWISLNLGVYLRFSVTRILWGWGYDLAD